MNMTLNTLAAGVLATLLSLQAIAQDGNEQEMLRLAATPLFGSRENSRTSLYGCGVPVPPKRPRTRHPKR